MKNRKPKADGRYSINVSFTANETSLISWADKHGNFSNYVKRLIEADMQKKESANEIPNDVLQAMMLKMISSKSLKDVFQSEADAETSVSIDEEIKEPQEEKKKLNKSAIKNIMKKNK